MCDGDDDFDCDGDEDFDCDGDDDFDGYLLTECAADNDYPVCTASVYNRGSHVSHQMVTRIFFVFEEKYSLKFCMIAPSLKNIH